LRQQNEYLTALHETTLGLMNRLELDDLLEAIITRAAALIGTPHGYIYLVEPGQREIVQRSGVGVFSKFIGHRRKPEEGLAGKVWQTGQSLAIGDYRTWPGRLPGSRLNIFRAEVGVPLKSGPEVVGVIGLAYLDEGRIFGDAAIALLSRFAELASIALDNARLYTSLQQELTERKRVEEALRRLEKAVETMQLGVTITDIQGKILYTNPSEASMHGYRAEELIHKDARRIFAPPELWKPMTLEEIKEARTWKREGINVRKDGSTFPVQLISDVVKNDAGQPIGIITICEDITQRKQAEEALKKAKEELELKVAERTLELKKLNEQLLADIARCKQTEEALRESEERYALAVQGANDGLWDWNLKTSEVYFSARWKSMLGCGENEIGNSPEEWFNRVHPEDIERVRAAIAAHLKGSTSHFESEYRILHKDGVYRWVLSRGLAVRDVGGKAYRMAGSQTDTTERKAAQEQLLHNAFYDALTGLPNRTLFMEHLERALKRVERHKDYLFAVLFLDLDRFKIINDSLGHLAGDQLLIAIARRLEACLRAGDTVGRLGGDEFVILLDDIRDVSDATRVADRIQKSLALPFSLRGLEVFTTASIGIALNVPAYSRAEDLLRDADTAMYRAKMLGKARYEVFDTVLHTRALKLLQLETDLRRAIEHQEFQLHYQPILSLITGEIVGFEALLRWQHPQRGLVSPEEFISVAEETGLIVPIGEWALRTACVQNKTWQEADLPPLYVAVNLSGRQFKQQDLIERIIGILTDTGLDSRWLELELTESIIMEDAETTIKTLRELEGLGVQLSIDDFGTGYSSLSYLKRFPIDTLKIDRSFVSDITTDPDDAAIITTIITLAHSLKLEVIAEGVETREQLDFLRSQQCDKVQGYLFSQPVPAKMFEKLLREGPHLTP